MEEKKSTKVCRSAAPNEAQAAAKSRKRVPAGATPEIEAAVLAAGWEELSIPRKSHE